MAVQFIRKVRDKQPTGYVAVDKANPITTGLIFASYGNTVVGQNRLKGTQPITVTTSHNGLVLSTINHTDYYYVDGNYITPKSTLFVLAKPISYIGSNSGVIGYDVSTKGSYIKINSANRWRFSVYDTAQRDAVDVTAPSLNIFEPICGTHDGSTARLYRLGIEVASVSASSATGVASEVRLGPSGGSTAGFGGFLACVFIWNRALNASEVESISKNPWQVFSPETIPLFFSTVTAQYASPTSDVSAGTWTASSGSDLFAMLDETAASDADYIVTTGASTCEVALGTLSDPSSSSGHIVRYRIAADSGGITVRLRQGATTIATWTHAPAPTSLTTYEQTLTGGEADSITSYSSLSLQFEAV